jgi:hypothetical protein
MDRTKAVELLRRLHEAQQTFYSGGDEAPVRALLADDIHWHVPGRNAIAGDYLGIEAVLAYFRRRGSLWTAPSGCIPAMCWPATETESRPSPMERPWSVASSGAGRLWACTRFATGRSWAAGCYLSTRPPSTTSGQVMTGDLADHDLDFPSA